MNSVSKGKRCAISNLCAACPNNECPGVDSPSDPNACRTYITWEAGDISYEHAIDAKKDQHHRHKMTDEYRDWAFDRVLQDQPIQNLLYKRLVGRFVSFVSKGHSPYQLRDVNTLQKLEIDDELCIDLIKQRFEMVPYQDTLY